MKLIKYPTKDQWTELLKRPALNTESLFDTVRSIIDKVRAEGDKAVLEYEATFDKVTLSSLVVTPEEIRVAETLVSDKLKAAISLAKQNIETFHSAQRFVGKKVETMNGVTCWQKAVGIEKVGLYIPGGTAPLFSTVLMLAVPAKIAGCKEIILCTPPDKEGNIHPAILFAAQLAVFYNLNLRCYVVIELKTGEFKPEYAGQLNFYLSAVDGILKKDRDYPSIGLLLCKSKNDLVAEYTLKDMSKPMGVSAYKVTSSLPEELQRQLPSIEDIEKRIQKK